MFAYRLSKSRIPSSIQCFKRLFLGVHFLDSDVLVKLIEVKSSTSIARFSPG